MSERTATRTADPMLVRRLRGQVADRLNQQRRSDEVARAGADGAPRTSGSSPARSSSRCSRTTPGRDHRRADAADRRGGGAVAAAVHAALFGVGRLQPLLEDPEVENIDINGYDRVFVSYADGREELAEPVAESDEELIELIQILAAQRRAWPQPALRLRQPPARPAAARRLAALGRDGRSAPGPACRIRRSRLGKVSLDDLVGNGTMTAQVGAVPAGRGPGPQEHHDRRVDELREDHAAARAGQRDPARTSG